MQIPLILDNKITLSVLIAASSAAATADDFLTPPFPESSSLQVSAGEDRDRLEGKELAPHRQPRPGRRWSIQMINQALVSLKSRVYYVHI